MGIIAKIALRNIFANRRRSILIGIVIFICAFLILVSNSMANGVEFQVLKGYKNIQCAHVIVCWDNLKKVNASDATRLLFLTSNPSFELTKDAENQKAINTLNEFLEKNKDKVDAYYPSIRRSISILYNGGEVQDSQFSLYGLNVKSSKLLIDSKAMSMYKGELLSKDPNTICISKQKAEEDNLNLGDKVTLESINPDGSRGTLDCTIKGIYANGAGWDNMYLFINENTAKQLMKYKDSYFDLGRITLKNEGDASKFAKDLDAALTKDGSKVLRAESYLQASKLYPTMSKSLKGLCNLFILIFLVVISIGLRSSIRMNLFERMREFGTLRAIGYSRRQCFSIIFLEVFFLSIIALSIACGISAVLVNMLGKSGVYLGTGPLSYFGGERLYPSMKPLDISTTFGIITLFTLLSTVSPALKLCYQNITDVMVKNMKKVKVWRTMFFGEKHSKVKYDGLNKAV